MYLKLSILLYADDMIILADTPECLQKGLDMLYQYCNVWHLSVNTLKTKVLIFSRGKLRRNVPEFIYGEYSYDKGFDFVKREIEKKCTRVYLW
jgi:hypothetical protein